VRAPRRCPGVVEVHYVGVEYDTGEEFDSSWNRGESIEFPLRGLIQAAGRIPDKSRPA
jgi:peptidylprolyl isomerase